MLLEKFLTFLVSQQVFHLIEYFYSLHPDIFCLKYFVLCQYFYDQFNHPVESFIVDSPVIFNTRMLHAVPRQLTDTGPRWVLMMDLFEWVDKLFDKIDNKTIWTDTKNFKNAYLFYYIIYIFIFEILSKM